MITHADIYYHQKWI